jgi:hypothetical protein
VKARNAALPEPEGRRFWSVNLGTENEPNAHHFRMPRYTVACGVLALGKRYDTSKLGQHLAHGIRAQYHAALVGACWHNRTAQIEAGPPSSTLADFDRYGESVIDELQDRYDLDQITTMGEACEAEISARLGYVARAAERARDFTAAPSEAGAAQASETAEQSSPERPST